MALLGRALEQSRGDPVTLIGMSVSGLQTDDVLQLALDLDGGGPPGTTLDRKRRSLDASVDAVRERFGRGLLKLGRTGRGDDAFRRLSEKD